MDASEMDTMLIATSLGLWSGRQSRSGVTQLSSSCDRLLEYLKVPNRIILLLSTFLRFSFSLDFSALLFIAYSAVIVDTTRLIDIHNSSAMPNSSLRLSLDDAPVIILLSLH